MYGYLLKIISTYEIREDNSNSIVEINCDLGRDLVNNYYYSLYSQVRLQTKDPNYYLSH
jgi:hypothetical protein